MIDWNTYRMTEWNEGENFEYAKKEILSILKEQKVSLSKVRCLFNRILLEIEDKNPISLPLKNHSCNESKTLISSNELKKLNIPEGCLTYTMPSYHPSEKIKKELSAVELS